MLLRSDPWAVLAASKARQSKNTDKILNDTKKDHSCTHEYCPATSIGIISRYPPPLLHRHPLPLSNIQIPQRLQMRSPSTGPYECWDKSAIIQPQTAASTEPNQESRKTHEEPTASLYVTLSLIYMAARSRSYYDKDGSDEEDINTPATLELCRNITANKSSRKWWGNCD